MLPESMGNSRSVSDKIAGVADKRFQQVVLPAPLRPVRAIFSPRVMLALKIWMTFRSS
jgi:hypothetical protein